MPQHLKCLDAVLYDLLLITILVSNCHLFSDITISQGSVATRLRCSGICSYHCTANLSPSLTVKSFENRLRFDKVTAMSLVVHFLEHSVVSLATNIVIHIKGLIRPIIRVIDVVVIGKCKEKQKQHSHTQLMNISI